MAERRMFTKNVVQTGKFLRMQKDAGYLYFQLGMSADDDGIVEAWNVIRLIGVTEKELDILVDKGLVVILDKEELIAYIVDWEKNNQIRKDRKHESIYIDLLRKYQNGIIDQPIANQLSTDCQPTVNQVTTNCQPIANQLSTKNDNNSVSDDVPGQTDAIETQSVPAVQPSDNQVTTNCQPSDNKCETEDRIGKDRLGKVSLGKYRIGKDRLVPDSENLPTDQSIEINFDEIQDEWNTLAGYGIHPLRIIGPRSVRADDLRKCFEQFGADSFHEIIDQIKHSDYLQGKTDRANSIDFGWAIKIENYTKILEGFYRDNPKRKAKAINFVRGVEEPNYDEIERNFVENL